MKYQEFIEKRTKDEKFWMKKRLQEWGGALDLCTRKQEQMRRVEKLRDEQRKIWEGNQTEIGTRMMAQLEKRYEAEWAGLAAQMEEILRKKAEMDDLLQILPPEEQTFVILRYEKGFGFDYIGMKMHMSRATLFRLQDKLLQRLLAAEAMRREADK